MPNSLKEICFVLSSLGSLYSLTVLNFSHFESSNILKNLLVIRLSPSKYSGF